MTRLRRFVLALAVCGGAWVLPMSAHAADSTQYTVRDGDSLYGIAAKSGVDLNALLDANDLTLTSVIVPGQHLSIPGDPTSSSSPEAASTYTVTWGDSLSKIAGRHGVSLSSLLGANDLTSSSLILPGMRLRLPAGAATAPPTPASSSEATATASYTVTWGDSLSKIAGRHGVSLSSLLGANDLTVSSLILPGRRLQIPAGATAPNPAPPSAATPSSPTPSSESPGDDRVDAVVRYALAQQGKPYEFFTKGPDSFDCSGLTLAAYAQAGIKLVHYSAAQARQGTDVDLSSDAIRPGDLVFLKRRGSATINHVGIAIDAGTWIQATGYGDTVRVGPMPASSTIVAVRRFINP